MTIVTYDSDGAPIATIDLSKIPTIRELQEVTPIIVEQLVLPSDFSHPTITIVLSNVFGWLQNVPDSGTVKLNSWKATVEQVAQFAANELADRMATYRPKVVVKIEA